MKCGICGRDNLAERELVIHTKYFHKVSYQFQQPQRFASGACPECGVTLWFQDGCSSCPSCGFSKCG